MKKRGFKKIFFLLSIFSVLIFLLSPKLIFAQEATTDATLIVKKVVYDPSYNTTQNPANDLTNFQFNVNGTQQTIQANDQQIFQVSSGTNTVTEIPDSNYVFWGCSADTTFTKDTPPNGLSVDLAPGQTATVTCINSQKLASVTINKNIQDSDGNPLPTDTHVFNVKLDSGNTYSFSQSSPITISSINPGIHSITELADTMYENLGCKLPDGSDTTNFTLLSGQDTSIYCTNKQKPQEINGYIYRTDGATPMQNWTVNLQSCNNDYSDCKPKTSTVTDINGKYSFVSLASGYYNVIEVLQPGYTSIGQSTHPIQLLFGQTIPLLNFTVFKNVNIKICVKEDIDGNLSTTNDQNPLPDWTITLLRNEQLGDILETETDGCFSYNKGPGSYMIAEVSNSNLGWTQLNDTNLLYDFGQAEDGVDLNHTFFEFRRLSISGIIFNDLNGNGVKENGESPLSNWIVYNDENNNNTFDLGEISATSLSDGSYNLSDLGPGNYSIKEVSQTGWKQTTTNPSVINGLSGSLVSNVNFGSQGIGKILVHKMLDSTGNGTFNQADGNVNFSWNLDGAGVNAMGSMVQNIPAGQHSVNETSISGYSLVGWYNNSDSSKSCSNPTSKTLPAILSVSANSNSEITICNKKTNTTSLTIDKITLPFGDLTKFKIDLFSGKTQVHESVLSDKDAPDTYSLTPGTYNLKEQSTKGWTLAFTYCVSNSKNHTNISINSFTLTSNEHIACSFVNLKTGNLSLSQIAQIINDLSNLIKTLFG